MPGTILPISVDKILRRVQSLTRTPTPSESMSDGEDGVNNVLKRSRSGRMFSAFVVRRSRSLSRMDSLSRDVPEGCLPVYVGGERKRFVINTKHLNHPLFKAILKRSEEEFGFNHQGGLTIACDPAMFQHLLWVMSTNNPSASEEKKLEELLDLYAW